MPGDIDIMADVRIGNGSENAANNTSFPAGGFFVGDIAEVIIFQGQLSTADHLAVENIPGAKHGVSISSPRWQPADMLIHRKNSGEYQITAFKDERP